ncbi:DNA repair exonuclease [Corallococcus sp. AS-1-12]|uniref:metallophosphoesterase family protein n=1 Tax=Corallococcus sp. AS-1-12 TaxID=2874598 RepID=UPI001CBC3B48|nr:DNA repair exonuclease [Corallococcus sp. AS-1-12]MBZ4336568.1 DNA repair exonuclease [Corallococcus sp. AS-1-12]
MIRLLHTADWQMGLRAKHVAGAAGAIRDARLDAARQLIQTANTRSVDAVVLAGDIFEDTSVGDRLVHEVLTVLKASRAPVYVLPGNHDPLTPDSVYLRPSWKGRPPHVHMLDSDKGVSIPGTGALLLPAPLRQKKGLKDPTATWGPRVEGNDIRIGVAHGSLRIEGKHAADDFPIALDTVTRSNLDYLALGHWHGQYVHQKRAAYSGTHEATKFGEDGAGQALLVEIASHGAMPQLTAIPTGTLTWKTLELDMSLGGGLELARVRTAVSEWTSPEKTLLRLRTRGTSSEEDTAALNALLDELHGQGLLHVELDRQDVPRQAAEGRLAELVPSSALLTALVESLSAKAPVPGIPVTPEAIQPAARQLLSEFVMEIWK